MQAGVGAYWGQYAPMPACVGTYTLRHHSSARHWSHEAWEHIAAYSTKGLGGTAGPASLPLQHRQQCRDLGGV